MERWRSGRINPCRAEICVGDSLFEQVNGSGFSGCSAGCLYSSPRPRTVSKGQPCVGVRVRVCAQQGLIHDFIHAPRLSSLHLT